MSDSSIQTRHPSKSAFRSASVSIIPPFHDVDLMEVVWHGHYIKYFEVARGALLDQFDYNYAQMKASGYAWPVVELQVKYVRPATLGSSLTVRADLMEWENRLKIVYEIRDVANTLLTRAHTVQVAVTLATGELCYVSPKVLYDKLGIAL